MKLLAAGFLLSLLGSLPPGMISLTVANTAIRRGLAAALMLAAGAAFAEFFQAWVAVVLSDWFLKHPAIENVFQWVAMVIFIGLGIFLIFFAKPVTQAAEVARISLPGQFMKGIVISSINLMAIPYWFAYCGWLRMEGWWQEGLSGTILFCAGVTIGTMFALSIYTWLGLLIVRHAGDVARKANRIVGLIFLGLGVKSLLGILF